MRRLSKLIDLNPNASTNSGRRENIIELNIPSYRLEHAKTNLQSLGADRKETAAAAPDSGEPPSGSPESQVNVAEA